MTCRHRKSWIIASGWYEWCYQCGAMRELIKTSPNGSQPYTRWFKPTGPNGRNPYDSRTVVYRDAARATDSREGT